MKEGPGIEWRNLALPLASLAIAAVIVFHGALGFFFSQDDFGWMARARGLIDRTPGPWRFFSLRLYWDLMRPLGMNALAYHLVSLAAHVAATWLLFDLLRRRVSVTAAWLGAVFFAVHPALYTALYWASAIGDVWALLFVLATLRVIDGPGRWRWLAVPLFAGALMSKESVLLLPLWIGLATRKGWRRALDPLVLSLVAVAAIHFATLYFQNISGLGSGGSEPSAYALKFDRTPWLNLLTYVGWTVNFLYATVSSVSDGVDPSVFMAGGVAMALWLVGLAWRRLRQAGWLEGGLLYAALLLPVLPLGNHTYHYYLYAPLAGAAWCLAAAFDGVLVRPSARASAKRSARGSKTESRPSQFPVGVAAVVGALLVWNGALLVRKVESFPFLVPELRADPIVDRARIARNVYDGLRTETLPAHARLIFWSPQAIALQRQGGRDTTMESYFEKNVRGALYEGIGVRVMAPAVDSVEFVRAFHPADSSSRYVLYRVDGRITLFEPAVVESALRSGPP